MRVNYVAAFKEIEFEFLVFDSDAAWANKWRRLVLGAAAKGEGSGEEALMRRVAYVEEEEEEQNEKEGLEPTRSRRVDDDAD